MCRQTGTRLTVYGFLENMMANALVRVFSDFSTAQNAREQLLQSGFPTGDVQLTSIDDEAGPVEGNFWVGNGGAASEGVSGMLGPKGGTDQTIYGPDFQHPVQRGTFILTVETTDAQRRDQACEIIDRFAANDIDRH
jgi:hypothetical protein